MRIPALQPGVRVPAVVDDESRLGTIVATALLEADGRPVADVPFVLSRVTSTFLEFETVDLATGADGRASFTGLEAGSYQVESCRGIGIHSASQRKREQNRQASLHVEGERTIRVRLGQLWIDGHRCGSRRFSRA